jgi:hypothetical protein
MLLSNGTTLLYFTVPLQSPVYAYCLRLTSIMNVLINPPARVSRTRSAHLNLHITTNTSNRTARALILVWCSSLFPLTSHVSGTKEIVMNSHVSPCLIPDFTGRRKRTEIVLVECEIHAYRVFPSKTYCTLIFKSRLTYHLENAIKPTCNCFN